MELFGVYTKQLLTLILNLKAAFSFLQSLAFAQCENSVCDGGNFETACDGLGPFEEKCEANLFESYFAHKKSFAERGFDGDVNAFAHGRGIHQFSNVAFVGTPLALRTVPYSTLGCGFAYLLDGEPLLNFTVLNATDTASTIGLANIPIAHKVALGRCTGIWINT